MLLSGGSWLWKVVLGPRGEAFVAWGLLPTMPIPVNPLEHADAAGFLRKMKGGIESEAAALNAGNAVASCEGHALWL
jgi:hypothetical protein